MQLEITLFGVQTEAAGVFAPFLAPPMGQVVGGEVSIPVGVHVSSATPGFAPPP